MRPLTGDPFPELSEVAYLNVRIINLKQSECMNLYYAVKSTMLLVFDPSIS